MSRKSEKIIRTNNHILRLLTEKSSRKEYLDAIVGLVSQLSRCRCVGVRILNEGRMIPYESYMGFSKKFWESENWLSIKHDQCACIRVITGKSGPQDKQVMTSFGSFHCTDTIKLMSRFSEMEKSRYRGVCVQCGFKSVSIIPIHYKNKIIGAIHLADKNAGKVSFETVKFIEQLTPLIGEGTNKFNLHDKIQHSNELLEKIFSSTHFLIAYMDPEFNFIRVNEAYARADCQNTGFFVGKNHFELYPDEENERIFRRVLETGELYVTYAKPFVYPKNPERGVMYWDWTLQPVKDSSGKIEGLVIVLVDVTKRKQYEEELIRTQKELNDAKRLSDIGTLSAIVAHELRNPLTAIQIAAYNIRKKSQNPLIESNLVNIEKKIYESNQTINNLLFYSRIKMPNYEDVNLYDIIEECISIAKKRSYNKNVVLNKRYKSLKKVSIDVDPVQIKELFNNIFNNAYDAVSGDKGVIEIGCSSDKKFVRVYVKDNGIGINKDDLDKIYKPFFSTKAKGTGLGLSVCHQIIELHNGSINVGSEVNNGTTVNVVLPARRKFSVTK